MKTQGCLLFSALICARMLAAQEIALTFDDAPMADGLYYTGVARTETLIAKLKNQNVAQVAFYCVSSRADSAGRVRLRRYAEAGHIIANHSHSHARIQQLGAAGSIQDIFKADAILRELPGFKSWFRFPFLDEGRTIADRDAIRQALSERGYFNGYVTVDNYDWYFDRLLQTALREKKKVDYEKLEQLYLEHLWQSVTFYDRMALANLGRSPKHVLLLHENDLAALFVDGLINFLRAKGWKIISPAEAYKDPIAAMVPDVLLNNQGRVAALAKANGYTGKFSQDSEDEEFLEKLFEQQHAAFRDRLMAQPRIANAAAAQSLPGREFDSTVFTPEQPANYQNTLLTYVMVNEQYAEVLKLKIVAGRNFSKEFATDSSAFLINETAAAALGWAEPLGKHLSMGDFYKGPVIGVVEDFHFESFHHEVKPILFMFNRWRPSYLAVRLRPGNVPEGVAAIQKLWKEFVPNVPLQYSFLDQVYQKLYDGERRVAQIFIAFSILAIVIACLGLFGLASFMAEQRTKEIGVRKVLGATVSGIVGLLSKDFVKLVLVAFAVATPMAYFAMQRWLQDFAYRIDIGWWVFALAGGIALAIALLTVSAQAIKAALANPVEALRYE